MISTYVHVSAYKYNDIYLIFAHNDMKIGGGGNIWNEIKKIYQGSFQKDLD